MSWVAGAPGARGTRRSGDKGVSASCERALAPPPAILPDQALCLPRPAHSRPGQMGTGGWPIPDSEQSVWAFNLPPPRVCARVCICCVYIVCMYAYLCVCIRTCVCMSVYMEYRVLYVREVYVCRGTHTCMCIIYVYLCAVCISLCVCVCVCITACVCVIQGAVM